MYVDRSVLRLSLKRGQEAIGRSHGRSVMEAGTGNWLGWLCLNG